jgi:hypothetical protein
VIFLEKGRSPSKVKKKKEFNRLARRPNPKTLSKENGVTEGKEVNGAFDLKSKISRAKALAAT